VDTVSKGETIVAVPGMSGNRHITGEVTTLLTWPPVCAPSGASSDNGIQADAVS
jgi:hypothetical protein